MDVKVITIKSELESAQRLGLPTFTKVDTSVNDYDNTIIIRWGNSYRYLNNVGAYRDFKHVINPSKSIRLNVQKSKSILEISKVVKTPAIYLHDVPAGKLVVVRSLEHTGGINFKVEKGPFIVESGFYAKDYVQTPIEYRVWFCGRHTMAARRIALKSNVVGKYPCRSTWGYSYCDMPKGLDEQTLLASKSIGLQSGAADVLYKNKKFYFLELNSAPSIDTFTLERFYKNGFSELIEDKFHIN
jgi:hypothetical protein